MPDDLEAAIAVCEAHDYAVVKRRDDPSEQLKQLMDQVYKLLRMAEDIAADGGRLPLKHQSCFSPNADMIAFTRAMFLGKIDAVLANARVEMEE